MNRQSTSDSVSAGTPTYPLGKKDSFPIPLSPASYLDDLILECIFDYKANLFDELTISKNNDFNDSLDVGELVRVSKKYDDGMITTSL